MFDIARFQAFHWLSLPCLRVFHPKLTGLLNQPQHGPQRYDLVLGS